jgi:hypothetical protein
MPEIGIQLHCKGSISHLIRLVEEVIYSIQQPTDFCVNFRKNIANRLQSSLQSGIEHESRSTLQAWQREAGSTAMPPKPPQQV